MRITILRSTDTDTDTEARRAKNPSSKAEPALKTHAILLRETVCNKSIPFTYGVLMLWYVSAYQTVRSVAACGQSLPAHSTNSSAHLRAGRPTRLKGQTPCQGLQITTYLSIAHPSKLLLPPPISIFVLSARRPTHWIQTLRPDFRNGVLHARYSQPNILPEIW